MNLTSLSNDELIKKLTEVREKEKEATLLVLYYLIELDSRKLYRELGYSSLYDYCFRGLKYSEASSYRRVSGARAIKDNPELATLFMEGKVSLCTIALASKSIKEEKTSVSEIVGKSKREVEVLIAPEVKALPKESIKPIAFKASSTPIFESSKEELYRISFSLKKETYKQYERVKNLLSNKLGSKLSVERVFEELLRRELKRRRVRKAKINTRYVPRALKEKIRDRDNHQCTFISEDGVRCTERHYLQFDHVVPFSRGGLTTSSNLRLLCPSHNQLHAEKCNLHR